MKLFYVFKKLFLKLLNFEIIKIILISNKF